MADETLPPGEPPMLDVKRIPGAAANAVLMDQAAMQLGVKMPGGLAGMFLYELFAHRLFKRGGGHNLRQIALQLPRETATFARAALIRDDAPLQSGADLARLLITPDEGDFNILNGKFYAIMALENQQLKNPADGPLHQIMQAVEDYMRAQAQPLTSDRLTDPKNPLATTADKPSAAQQIAFQAGLSLAKSRQGRNFLRNADKIASARTLPDNTAELITAGKAETALRQSQLRLFSETDGMMVILPAKLGAGYSRATAAYTLATQADGTRIAYRFRQGQFETIPLNALYDDLRRNADQYEPLQFKPDPVYAALGPPPELLPDKKTAPATPPAKEPPKNAPPPALPPVITVQPPAAAPVTLTIYATPKCPFINYCIGPFIRLFSKLIKEQGLTGSIHVAVIGKDADAREVQRNAFGNGRYPVSVIATGADAALQYKLGFSGNFVLQDDSNLEINNKGWSQQTVLDLAEKLGIGRKAAMDAIQQHAQARDAFKQLPPNQPIQGCEFQFSRPQAGIRNFRAPLYAHRHAANEDNAFFVSHQSHRALMGRMVYNDITTSTPQHLCFQAAKEPQSYQVLATPLK